MLSTMRAVAVTSCTALLVAGGFTVAATAPAATPQAAPSFTVHPSFGAPGATVTLKDGNFAGTTGVQFHGVTATFTQVSAHKLTAVVPSGATAGKVTVVEGLTTLTGPRFTVQKATAAISKVSKGIVTYTHHVLLTGRETYTTSGKPVVGATADIQRLGSGGNWRRVKSLDSVTTGTAGRARFNVKPHSSTQYRVYFRQSHAVAGASSPSQKIKVLPYLKLHPLHTVGALSTTSIKGTVHPHLGGKVYLQKLIGSSWHKVATASVVNGKFRFHISPKQLGHVTYRVVRHHDKTFGTSTSRELKLQIVHRSLQIGDSGKDVLALQQQLRKLHYDVGPKSSSYGDDLLHAVTAFEKVNGLTKDGSAGPKVWKKLSHATKVHLKHPIASAKLAVEVNLKKQILIMSRYGKVWRILDTSTAGGYYFTDSEGQSEKAVTPTGHFTIQYKITGHHTSDLGDLYYPSYFTNTGYAIHGEGNGNDGGEVPPYANSHGCVRITDNAVLRYYSQLVVGTSVWIYG